MLRKCTCAPIIGGDDDAWQCRMKADNSSRRCTSNFPNRSFHGNKNLTPFSNLLKTKSESLAHTLSAANELLLSYRKMKFEEKSFMSRPSFQNRIFPCENLFCYEDTRRRQRTCNYGTVDFSLPDLIKYLRCRPTVANISRGSVISVDMLQSYPFFVFLFLFCF